MLPYGAFPAAPTKQATSLPQAPHYTSSSLAMPFPLAPSNGTLQSTNGLSMPPSGGGTETSILPRHEPEPDDDATRRLQPRAPLPPSYPQRTASSNGPSLAAATTTSYDVHTAAASSGQTWSAAATASTHSSLPLPSHALDGARDKPQSTLGVTGPLPDHSGASLGRPSGAPHPPPHLNIPAKRVSCCGSHVHCCCSSHIRCCCSSHVRSCLLLLWQSRSVLATAAEVCMLLPQLGPQA